MNNNLYRARADARFLLTELECARHQEENISRQAILDDLIDKFNVVKNQLDNLIYKILILEESRQQVHRAERG